MTQPIWYDSAEAGAPTLNNVAGSMLEVLRACLINGFGSNTVTSIAVASGVATVTCAAHGFSGSYGKLVLMAGSAEPLLNGNKQIGNLLTNSFTYAAPGVADGTYTGTLSAKRAPLGWTEAFTGANKAIFARTVVEANVGMLRVDDSHVAPSTATDARMIMVESATGVDSYTNPCPTEAQFAGGTYLPKGANSATAKPWVVCGDGRFLWLFMPSSNTTVHAALSFGDGVPYHTPDPYFTILAGCSANYISTSTLSYGAAMTVSGAEGYSVTQSVLRDRAGVLTSQLILKTGVGSSGVIGGVGSQTDTTVPTVVAGPYWFITQDDAMVVRGEVPGLYRSLSAPLSGTAPEVVAAGGTTQFLKVNVRFNSNNGMLLLNLSDEWY